MDLDIETLCDIFSSFHCKDEYYELVENYLKLMKCYRLDFDEKIYLKHQQRYLRYLREIDFEELPMIEQIIYQYLHTDDMIHAEKCMRFIDSTLFRELGCENNPMYQRVLKELE